MRKRLEETTRIPLGFQGMTSLPNRHKNCAHLPKNKPFLQLNCFQGLFLVSKEKRTLPKHMATVPRFIQSLLPEQSCFSYLSEEKIIFPQQIGAGILTCFPFDIRHFISF